MCVCVFGLTLRYWGDSTRGDDVSRRSLMGLMFLPLRNSMLTRRKEAVSPPPPQDPEEEPDSMWMSKHSSFTVKTKRRGFWSGLAD